ncbi:MAG: T9SS type A sorting domain-containing protein, partial [Ferruginibacter sp.]|nr:T9SS type A sorting domain-containing protein [Ferruginibacter sp.]
VKVDFTNIVLPFTLLSFNARTEGNRVKLEWKVTSELNMDKYIVEHSIDGTHFSDIGERDAIANNGGEANYMLYHNKPVTGINYYRLRQIERDGNFEYSQIVAINFSKGLDAVSIFPNPATSFFKIETRNRIQEVRLVDLTGKLLVTYPHQSAYTLENIPAGAYLVRIYLSNGQIISKPIVVGR